MNQTHINTELPLSRIQSPVLISPLNWGLGHTTRCIPIIYDLLKGGYQIVLAAEGKAATLLSREFPALEVLPIPSFDIHYAEKNFSWSIFKQIPKILSGIGREHYHLKSIVEKYGIKTVISDNRYGLWNKSAYSIFISHQINIQLPQHLTFGQGMLNWINRRMINRFDECWIPDFANADNISGVLSHPSRLNIPTTYIGFLSRFKHMLKPRQNKRYQFAFILSGTEPLRTVWEKQILAMASSFERSSILVRGMAGEEKKRKEHQLEIVDWMTANEIERVIECSEYIVCRSGYSSMMDLAILGRRAIVVATPGQTEQEYLARYLSSKSMMVKIDQAEFSMDHLLNAAKKLEE